LVIKFHLVSIVKPLDAILNFDLVLPLLYQELLLSSQYALLNIERPTKYHIIMSIYLFFFSLGSLVICLI
jgi:hypothetical protein